MLNMKFCERKFKMHELLKERTGIKIANCETCAYLTGVGDKYVYFT